MYSSIHSWMANVLFKGIVHPTIKILSFIKNYNFGVNCPFHKLNKLY